MRILFITSNPFIPEHFSEQNRTLIELCSRLFELNHEPVILASKASSFGQSNVTADRRYGFRVFRASNPIKSLPALCTALCPDIAVVVDGHFEGLIEQFQSLDYPLAIYFFHVEPHYFCNASLDRRYLYLSSSPFLARRINGLFGVETKVVPPYIEQRNYLRTHHGNRILFVNPVREKGVEIAFQLAQQRPNIAFTFMESWGISERWRAICFERALLCGNIEWLPPTTSMTSVLDNSRLLLVPRFNEEGFCRLVTEAQLRGIPVLTSDRGYLAANVGPGGTILKIDDDISTWLEALDKYFADHNYYQQISKEAKIHATRDETNGNQIIDHLLMLLTSQISKHRHNRLSFPNN